MLNHFFVASKNLSSGFILLQMWQSNRLYPSTRPSQSTRLTVLPNAGTGIRRTLCDIYATFLSLSMHLPYAYSSKQKSASFPLFPRKPMCSKYFNKTGGISRQLKNKNSNSCIFERSNLQMQPFLSFMSSISIECQTTCIIKQSHFFLAAPGLKTFVSLKRHDSFKTKYNRHEPCFQTISATPRQCPSNRSRLVICHV